MNTIKNCIQWGDLIWWVNIPSACVFILYVVLHGEILAIHEPHNLEKEQIMQCVCRGLTIGMALSIIVFERALLSQKNRTPWAYQRLLTCNSLVEFKDLTSIFGKILGSFRSITLEVVGLLLNEIVMCQSTKEQWVPVVSRRNLNVESRVEHLDKTNTTT